MGLLALSLTACTGRGGGQLPSGVAVPSGVAFTGPASFGFSFSCEDKGGLNPPTGQLRIQLSYTDHGSSILIGSPFSIHGSVDTLDPVVESMYCIGQNPPYPDPKQLTFLGRYRVTSSPAPPAFPSTCAARDKELCRFEVTVRDNDNNRAPSRGDMFKITLSGGTALDDELDPANGPLLYTRGGVLSSGNITVD